MRKTSAGFTFRILSVILFLSAGPYIFSQSSHQRSADRRSEDTKSEGGDFFNNYLFSALHVETYEPVYFFPFTMDFEKHDDRGPIEVFFQLSLKKNIVQDISPIGFNIGIAFTQSVWWQLYAFSNPVREINYAPELYFYFPFHRESAEGLFCRGIKLAVAHKSNGETGDDNRSWNRVFLEAPFSINWFMFIPRIWWSFQGIGDDFSEKDIPRYMGMCDLTLMGQWKGHLLKIYGRSNFNFKNIISALQVDYSYPIGASGFYVYLKYFFGYGESLIDYKKKVNKIGTGIAISR